MYNGCRYLIKGFITTDYETITHLGDGTQSFAYTGPLGACFTYGYVCTVHKAQGSEFESVRIVDDFSKRLAKGKPALRKQWAYTAVTRATKNLYIE